MDRIDKLILRAKAKAGPGLRLAEDNPYMGKNSEELLDMMFPESSGGYQAPEMRTPEWNKYIYALIQAVNVGELEE